MKDRVLNGCIIVLLGLAGYGITLYLDGRAPRGVETQTSAPAPMHTQIPAFSFTALDGAQHDIRDFRGKIVILNFWATWCAPCQKEFPALLRIADSHKDDIVLIALSSDIERAAIDRFLNKLSYKPRANVHIALDDSQRITAGLFQTYRLPETWIIDRQQLLKHKLIGAEWTDEDLRSIIEKIQ